MSRAGQQTQRVSFPYEAKRTKKKKREGKHSTSHDSLDVNCNILMDGDGCEVIDVPCKN